MNVRLKRETKLSKELSEVISSMNKRYEDLMERQTFSDRGCTISMVNTNLTDEAVQYVKDNRSEFVEMIDLFIEMLQLRLKPPHLIHGFYSELENDETIVDPLFTVSVLTAPPDSLKALMEEYVTYDYLTKFGKRELEDLSLIVDGRRFQITIRFNPTAFAIEELVSISFEENGPRSVRYPNRICFCLPIHNLRIEGLKPND